MLDCRGCGSRSLRLLPSFLCPWSFLKYAFPLLETGECTIASQANLSSPLLSSTNDLTSKTLNPKPFGLLICSELSLPCLFTHRCSRFKLTIKHQMASSSRSKKKTKKVGLSRMDAALDHLVPLGFKKQKINNTIKSLLKEYGGDEGWYFLEENNYLLVIDTIINDQNAIEDEQPLPLLPAPPSPPSPRCLPLQEEEEQLQNRVSSDEEIKMEVQRKCNGGGSGEVTTMKPAEIEFMDEKLLHIIPPGRCRPPLYGYLSETDSDFDAELDDDGHLPSP